MAKGAPELRPLSTVLAGLDFYLSKLVLVRGSHRLTVKSWRDKIRRDTAYGGVHDKSSYRFWAEDDADGRLVIFEMTPEGRHAFAAEEGSKYVPKGPELGETKSAGSISPGRQFERVVDGTRFLVVYKRHFVKRYTHDEGKRPAVARFLSPQMIVEEIEKALPQIKEMLEEDPYAQGILISKSYGLSMKFFAIPLEDGWQLDFATMIIAMPLWRTSSREVEIAINPVVPVHFEPSISENLQLALLADLAPRFMELAPGEEDRMAGELVRALVAHEDDGFHVSDADWKDDWRPFDI